MTDAAYFMSEHADLDGNAPPVPFFADWLGRPIRKGDIVVYPVRKGSSMDMHLARVVSIEGGVTVEGMLPKSSRKTKLHRLDRVTVIDLPGVSPQLPAIVSG